MSASYLDIDLAIDNEGYDINQYICSNIPAAPAYGVYISQLIRYSRAYGCYHDFLDRVFLLTRKLLNQGFLVVKLKSSLRKIYGQQDDLVLTDKKFMSHK
jgi:hypothetical protein